MSKLTALREKLSTIKRGRKGQSFVEAMVAITIIVSSISSSLALVQSSITSSRISGSQVIAANLAREGLEVIRSMRDTNWLAGRSFQVGLVEPGEKNVRPILDTANGTWSLNFGAVDLNDQRARMYVLPRGIYVQADDQPAISTVSQYSRRLVLDHICRNDVTGEERIETGAGTCVGGETLVGIAASSAVSFAGLSGFKRVVTAEERFYDWR